MKVEAANSIWGFPLLDVGTQRTTLRDEQSIQTLLQTFLSGQIEKHQPDLIIVVERKGTAILRALNEDANAGFEWPWENVISSEAIEQMPDEYFKSKRILIFDDMMKTSRHIRQVLTQLFARSLIDDLKTLRISVFAVHEECPIELESEYGLFSYSWFYRNLTSINYQSIQIQIVDFLQRSGSLMLDTEHLEVRLRLSGTLNRLVEALRRKAEVYTFHSSDGRMNITVFYEDDPAHSLTPQLFPHGTVVDDIVKKCRIVDRGGDEYAIIPICFPSIEENKQPWPIDEAHRHLLGDGVNRSGVARFYGVGLLAALEVLRWVLKDIAMLGDNDYSLMLPKHVDQTGARSGYTLEHLKVVFPTLRINELTTRVAEVDHEAKQAGNALRARKFKTSIAKFTTDAELHEDALKLLQVIRFTLDQRILESRMLSEVQPLRPPGLTLAEVLKLGKKLGCDRPRTSALCDILIDQAALSTDVMSVESKSGQKHVVRTFAPAGEVVSEMVRLYSTQWGLPL